jgi:hypothetical protein
LFTTWVFEQGRQKQAIKHEVTGSSTIWYLWITCLRTEYAVNGRKGVSAQHVSPTKVNAGLEHLDHPMADVTTHGWQKTFCTMQFGPNSGPSQKKSRPLAHVLA